MSPILMPSDRLLVDPSPEKLQVGDIAVFREGDSWMAHRVIVVGARGIVAMQDSQEHYDPAVGWDMVLGRVISAESPNGCSREIEYRHREGVQLALHGPGRETIRLITEAVGDKILEVGTGSGETAKAIAHNANCNVITVDKSLRALDVAKHRLRGLQNVMCMHADGEHLPFDESHFDCVIFYQSLHHFQEPWAAVIEAQRVLRSGGVCLVVEHQDMVRKVLANASTLINGNEWGNHPDGGFSVRDLIRKISDTFLINRISHYQWDVLVIAVKT